MSEPLAVYMQGLGAWAPGLPDWTAWRALLRGEGEPDDAAPARPKPACLAAGERRRVSTHILAAIAVAEQAVAMSGLDASGLPCLFASAHGDSGIMDYMCTVLADTPRHLSPTRFHNSVHNAAVGYWTIANDCHAASNAVAALDASFGAGLLEAAMQAVAEQQPVLLVAHDSPGSGPLGEVLGTTDAFACALVLSPHRAPATPRLTLTLDADAHASDRPRHPHAAGMAQNNPSAAGLALLEALAGARNTRIRLKAAPELGLALDIDAMR